MIHFHQKFVSPNPTFQIGIPQLKKMKDSGGIGGLSLFVKYNLWYSYGFCFSAGT
jgi:hypothetical protein